MDVTPALGDEVKRTFPAWKVQMVDADVEVVAFLLDHYLVLACSLTPGNPFRSGRMCTEATKNVGDTKAYGLRPSTAQLMLQLVSMIAKDGASAHACYAGCASRSTRAAHMPCRMRQPQQRTRTSLCREPGGRRHFLTAGPRGMFATFSDSGFLGVVVDGCGGRGTIPLEAGRAADRAQTPDGTAQETASPAGRAERTGGSTATQTGCAWGYGVAGECDAETLLSLTDTMAEHRNARVDGMAWDARSLPLRSSTADWYAPVLQLRRPPAWH